MTLREKRQRKKEVTTMRAQNQRLDPDRHSSEASEFEAALRERIIGQESAIRAVVDLY